MVTFHSNAAGLNPTVPGQTTPVSSDTLHLIQKMKSSSNLGVQSFGALADTVTSSGELNDSQKVLLAASAQIQLSVPYLTGPDQQLMQNFSDSVANMPVGTGGPSLPVGNAWLNVGAFVAVVTMLFDITSILSKIKLSESQLQIIMSKVNAEMAKNIAQATENTGALQAEMRMNDAYKALMQAGMAMASMALTAVSTVAREVMIANKTTELTKQGVTNPSIAQQLQISQMVDGEMMMMKSLTESLPTAVNALCSASVDARNAALEILKAHSEAAAGKLSKLADLLKGTIDTLRGDQSDLSQTISKLLDNFLSAFSRQRAGGNS